MRSIVSHIVEGDDAPQLAITVVDEPGSGGANHEYVISWEGLSGPEVECELPEGHNMVNGIGFQSGPIKEYNVNGVTEVSLLAILIDRLEHFQKGAFACESNEVALRHCRYALFHLQERTRKRIARGVEGQSKE